MKRRASRPAFCFVPLSRRLNRLPSQIDREQRDGDDEFGEVSAPAHVVGGGGRAGADGVASAKRGGELVQRTWCDGDTTRAGDAGSADPIIFCK